MYLFFARLIWDRVCCKPVVVCRAPPGPFDDEQRPGGRQIVPARKRILPKGLSDSENRTRVGRVG